MKYYTKDWYYLMQNLNLAMDMEPVLDKEYTEEEMQEMYQQALAQSVENNTKLYALMGRSVDVADLIADFEKAFKEKCQHVLDRYPDWVGEMVDPRLAALGKLPKTVHRQLSRIDAENLETFRMINDDARLDLDSQDLPEDFAYNFYFQDADVLSVKIAGDNMELYLRTGDETSEGTPYCKVVFHKGCLIDADPLDFSAEADEFGVYRSECRYLYEELYRTENGYEAHFLFKAGESLGYLTIGCEDITFDFDIELE